MICTKLHIKQEKNKNEFRTMLVILLTVVTMVAEISAGMIFGSIALLSDGIHMGTHTLALLITVIAYWVARKEATNSRFTFGTGKVGVLGGYTSAIALLIAAGFMIVEAVHRFFSPVEIGFNESIIVAVIGLLVNIVSAFLLKDNHSHSHDHSDDGDHHEHHHDHNLKAAYLHVVADALTSVLAIAALFGGKYLNAVWLDPAVGIVGAVVIIKWGVGLLRTTGANLLDYDNNDKMIGKVTSLVEEFGKGAITDLHIWQVASGKRALICRVEGVNSADEAIPLRQELEELSGFCHTSVSVS